MDTLLLSSDAVDLARVARLVRPFEALELHAVRRLSGDWSIGYGHVRSARAGAEVTREEADALLLYDLHHVAQAVKAAIFAPVNRNQLEALIAFAFHIGADSFLNSTTLQRLNAGDSLGAAQELERWCWAEVGGEAQVVDALVRRRAAEKAHFLTPPQGFPKASRARLQPQFDTSSVISGGEPAEAAPSAAMAAAHSVSARLRALVPDVMHQAVSPPSTVGSKPARDRESELGSQAEAIATRSLAAPTFDAKAADPVREPEMRAGAGDPGPTEAAALPEPEIPPPPMPFEALPADELHRLMSHEPAVPAPPQAEAREHEAWPSLRPGEARADDPFAQGPMDAAAFEAPPLDRVEPTPSLFRAKPSLRAETPAGPETAVQAQPRRVASGQVPTWSLVACLAAGLAIFLWSVWSIFKTDPSLGNFSAGLAGIAAMAVPAYLLLDANARR